MDETTHLVATDAPLPVRPSVPVGLGDRPRFLPEARLMPARSQAQREYLNARFGHAWVKKHGFDNPGKLPQHVGKKRKPGGTANSQLAKMLTARHK